MDDLHVYMLMLKVEEHNDLELLNNDLQCKHQDEASLFPTILQSASVVQPAF